VTLSSRKEVPSDIVVHGAKESGRKKRKQSPQWVTTATNHDGGNDEKADDSGVGHVATAARSGKRQAQLPMDHFERLFVEAYLNHAYPIKHNLKDWDTMKNFMISGSLSWGMEHDKDPSESDTMPFPGKDVAMMVHGGHPHQGGTTYLT
jgi:hypothetical protein